MCVGGRSASAAMRTERRGREAADAGHGVRDEVTWGWEQRRMGGLCCAGKQGAVRRNSDCAKAVYPRRQAAEGRREGAGARRVKKIKLRSEM